MNVIRHGVMIEALAQSAWMGKYFHGGVVGRRKREDGRCPLGGENSCDGVGG